MEWTDPNGTAGVVACHYSTQATRTIAEMSAAHPGRAFCLRSESENSDETPRSQVGRRLG